MATVTRSQKLTILRDEIDKLLDQGTSEPQPRTADLIMREVAGATTAKREPGTVTFREHLTQKRVDDLYDGRKPGVRTILRDLRHPGLSLVIGKDQARWVFEFKPKGYRPDGRQLPTRHMALGSFRRKFDPKDDREVRLLSLAEARDAYREAAGKRSKGGDPATEARAELAAVVAERAAEEQREKSLADWLPAFIERIEGKSISARHKRDEIRRARQAVEWSGAADRPPTEFGYDHIEAMIRRARAEVLRKNEARVTGTALPRQLVGTLGRFLGFLVKKKVIPSNPVRSLENDDRPPVPDDRTRVLSLDEAGRVYRAAAVIHPRLSTPEERAMWCRLVRFTLLIPARRGEVASMCFGHLDFAKARWSQPGKLTKNRDPHLFPLPPVALTILRDQTVARATELGRDLVGDDPVWVGPRDGKPMDAWGSLLRHIHMASGVRGWSFHDTRRTCVTNLAEHDVPESVADALLNHRQSATRRGVMGVYQRADRLKERLAALELWEGLVLRAASNV